jgi:hypothetical protein
MQPIHSIFLIFFPSILFISHFLDSILLDRILSEKPTVDHQLSILKQFERFADSMESLSSTQQTADGKRSKHKFTADEDTLIRQLVDQHGTKQWDVITRFLPNRTSRQVRDRWKHYLSPQVILRPWSLDEDRQLLRMTAQLGPQWSTLMKFFPGRTDVNLKNRWNKLQRRSKKLTAGIGTPVMPSTLMVPFGAQNDEAGILDSRPE